MIFKFLGFFNSMVITKFPQQIIELGLQFCTGTVYTNKYPVNQSIIYIFIGIYANFSDAKYYLNLEFSSVTVFHPYISQFLYSSVVASPLTNVVEPERNPGFCAGAEEGNFYTKS
jgi:hypothetical protein